MGKVTFLTDLIYNYCLSKEANRVNYVYCQWLNLPENYFILLSKATCSQIHSFQIDQGTAKNSLWTLTKVKSQVNQIFRTKTQVSQEQKELLTWIKMHVYLFLKVSCFLETVSNPRVWTLWHKNFPVNFGKFSRRVFL